MEENALPHFKQMFQYIPEGTEENNENIIKNKFTSSQDEKSGSMK
jgi:hypothetical protein